MESSLIVVKLKLSVAKGSILVGSLRTLCYQIGAEMFQLLATVV